MVPPLIRKPNAPGSRLLYPVASFIVHQVPKLASRLLNHSTDGAERHVLNKREEELSDGQKVAYAILIPVLVLLSGLFAGLTLGYMSLDETQLHVLSISGTPKQKEYARKIQPIRKNGHLLLITLILANMIANETLPIIFDPLLGGVVGVVASTALIVIFSEIIPQSICTRYGLAIGANMAWFVRILIFALGIISWPVAKFLELILGSHHGIMYRRAELKELIAMHSSAGELGGDLKSDTVTIIGATLDLQEKVVRQAMTPINKVFMLNKHDKLDHETMKRIYETGHSRIPIYEEVELPLIPGLRGDQDSTSSSPIKPRMVKKIIGVFLVKQCLMLDPKDATPISSLTLNNLPSVAQNFSLLQMLDKFQEGRSHMAVVSRMSYEKAASVKQEVKKGLTQRLKDRVGMGDSSSSGSSDDETDDETTTSNGGEDRSSHEGTLNGGPVKKLKWGRRRKSKKKNAKTVDLEKAEASKPEEPSGGEVTGRTTWEKISFAGREQSMPADAVLPEDGAEELLQNLDPMVMPLGIITLEDVLEELIGEEIYDEFDPEGHSHLAHYNPPSKRKAPRAPNTVAPPPDLGIPAVQVSSADPTDDRPELEERSHSQPPSRNASFATSLGALAFNRKQRGRSSSRTRQRQNLSASDTDLVRRLKAPGNRDEGRGKVSPHREESGEEDERIPGDAERHGPDIF